MLRRKTPRKEHPEQVSVPALPKSRQQATSLLTLKASSPRIAKKLSALGALLKQEGANWWKDTDDGAATLTRDSTSFKETPRAAVMRQVDADETKLGPFPEGLVGVYLRNRLLRQREETGTAPALDDVTRLLEEAAALGGPELAESAANLLETRGIPRKVGERPVVRLSDIAWNSSIGAGTLTWTGVGHWAMFDYKDQLPVSPGFCDRLHFAPADSEPKQCLLLHVAAAYLSGAKAALPTEAAVHSLALAWRERWYKQACVAEDSLGPIPARIAQAEADLRVFHHDLLHFGHDRDYRTLLAHPLEEWTALGLAVLRLDAYLRPSVEVICGRDYDGAAANTRGPHSPGPYAFVAPGRPVRPSSRQ